MKGSWIHFNRSTANKTLEPDSSSLLPSSHFQGFLLQLCFLDWNTRENLNYRSLLTGHHWIQQGPKKWGIYPWILIYRLEETTWFLTLQNLQKVSHWLQRWVSSQISQEKFKVLLWAQMNSVSQSKKKFKIWCREIHYF